MIHNCSLPPPLVPECSGENKKLIFSVIWINACWTNMHIKHRSLYYPSKRLCGGDAMNTEALVRLQQKGKNSRLRLFRPWLELLKWKAARPSNCNIVSAKFKVWSLASYTYDDSRAEVARFEKEFIESPLKCFNLNSFTMFLCGSVVSVVRAANVRVRWIFPYFLFYLFVYSLRAYREAQRGFFSVDYFVP